MLHNSKVEGYYYTSIVSMPIPNENYHITSWRIHIGGIVHSGAFLHKEAQPSWEEVTEAMKDREVAFHNLVVDALGM